jgi:hypothetical protein
MRSLHNHRWIAPLTVACWTVINATAVLAQDQAAPIQRTTTTTTFWVQPWAWATGAGIVVLLIVMLGMQKRGSRETTKFETRSR